MIEKPKISKQETVCSLQLNEELVGKFLTVQETASVLKVSNDTIYRLLDSRKISFHYVGGCKRILLEDLLEYLNKNKLQAHKA